MKKFIANNKVTCVIIALVVLALWAGLEYFQYKRYKGAIVALMASKAAQVTPILGHMADLQRMSVERKSGAAYELIEKYQTSPTAYFLFSQYVANAIYKNPSPMEGKLFFKAGFSDEAQKAAVTNGEKIFNLYKQNKTQFLGNYRSLAELKYSYPSITVFIMARKVEDKILMADKLLSKKAWREVSVFDPDYNAQWKSYYSDLIKYNAEGKKGVSPARPEIVQTQD